MARILVAEDDEGVRLLVTRALRLEGHHVETAEDGEFALETLVATDGGFDLLLSDIRMPAMTGIELAHAAHGQWPDLTILLMTGYAEQRERARSLDAIVSEVMTKPFTIADLRETVMKVIERSMG